MIRDPDLNRFKEALETYFEYHPEGPRTLMLDYDISRKLLNLLNNLEEFEVDTIIPHYKLSYFSHDEFMKYVRYDMAKKIADKLIEDGYVKFFSQSDVDPLGDERIKASAILLKRGIDDAD